MSSYIETIEFKFTDVHAATIYHEALEFAENHDFENPNDRIYLIDEIRKVACSKRFNKDHSQYMLDWLERKSVRKEQEVQRIAWNEVTRYLKDYGAYTTISKKLINKVHDFKGDDGKPLKKHVVQYIEMVAVSRAFNSNPQKYMAQWEVRRGNSEELRPLEDPAMQAISKFLKENLKQKQ